MSSKNTSNNNKNPTPPAKPLLDTPLDEKGGLSDFTAEEIADFRKHLAERAHFIKRRFNVAKNNLLDS